MDAFKFVFRFEFFNWFQLKRKKTQKHVDNPEVRCVAFLKTMNFIVQFKLD